MTQEDRSLISGKSTSDSCTHYEDVTIEELNFYLSVEKYLNRHISFGGKIKTHLKQNFVEGLSRRNLSQDFTPISHVDNSLDKGFKKYNTLDPHFFVKNVSRVSMDSPTTVEKEFPVNPINPPPT